MYAPSPNQKPAPLPRCCTARQSVMVPLASLSLQGCGNVGTHLGGARGAYRLQYGRYMLQLFRHWRHVWSAAHQIPCHTPHPTHACIRTRIIDGTQTSFPSSRIQVAHTVAPSDESTNSTPSLDVIQYSCSPLPLSELLLSEIFVHSFKG